MSESNWAEASAATNKGVRVKNVFRMGDIGKDALRQVYRCFRGVNQECSCIQDVDVKNGVSGVQLGKPNFAGLNPFVP